MLQARFQLKAIYKDNADTIIGNMDSQVFLGGSEPTTLKELAEALGKETIDNMLWNLVRRNKMKKGDQEMGLEGPYTSWWHMFGWNTFGILLFGPAVATHRFFRTLNKIETELNWRI